MDTHDGRAVGHGPGGGGGGAEEPLGRDRFVRDFSNETLAACADNQRPVEREKFALPAEEGEVVLMGFAESDAGIEENAGGGNAGGLGDRQSALEELRHIRNDVLITWVVLHRRRV